MNKQTALIVIIAAFLFGLYLGYFYEKQKMIKLMTIERADMQQQINSAKSVPTQQPNIKIGMANPAAVFCEDQGGKSKIVTAQDGSQGGECIFPDGRTCEEWAFFRTKICK